MYIKVTLYNQLQISFAFPVVALNKTCFNKLIARWGTRGPIVDFGRQYT
jgi:hypothetical protein